MPRFKILRRTENSAHFQCLMNFSGPLGEIFSTPVHCVLESRHASCLCNKTLPCASASLYMSDRETKWEEKKRWMDEGEAAV